MNMLYNFWRIITIMYEILVPCGFTLEHHKAWDTHVRSIAGGLTILKTARGQWIDKSNNLHAEYVIPIRIACTRAQLEQIIDFTLSHYKQKAVMAYKISDEVIIKYENN